MKRPAAAVHGLTGKTGSLAASVMKRPAASMPLKKIRLMGKTSSPDFSLSTPAVDGAAKCSPSADTTAKPGLAVKSADAPASKKAPLLPAPAGFDELFKLLSDTNVMQKYLEGLSFDLTAKPLGKLTPQKRMDGFRMLRALWEEMRKPSGGDQSTLTSLSGFFYNSIPHNFRGLNWADFVIDSPEKLQDEVLIVEALASIETACKVLKEPDGDTNGADQLAEYYRRLRCKLEPLAKKSDDFRIVQEYFNGTQAKSTFAMNICRIFRVDIPGEEKRFEPHAESKGRVLLWHGTHPVHWIGSLSRGLQVPPPGTPPIPQRALGQGIRFWDTAAGAAEAACFGSASGSACGLLFLAEVALDSVGTLEGGSCAQPSPDCQSMQAHGASTPKPGQRRKCGGSNDVRVPIGPLKTSSVLRRYNEFAVYEASRVQMRFVVQVEFRN